MSDKFVCGFCGMDLESPGQFHDLMACAGHMRTRIFKLIEERDEARAMVERLIEAGMAIEEDAYCNEGVVYLSTVQKFMSIVGEWKGREG